MNSVRIVIAPKANCEVNLAKVDSELDFQAEVECQLLEPKLVEVSDNLPVLTRSFLKGRTSGREVKRREYKLTETKGRRRRYWKGSNDYTGHYALAFMDQERGVMRIILADSFYRFSRVIGEEPSIFLEGPTTVFSEDSEDVSNTPSDAPSEEQL